MNVEIEIRASNTGMRSTYLLPMETPIVIGRSLDCHLPLEHAQVSRQHAVVRANDVLLRVEDTSRNGTLAGGTVLRRTTAEIPWGAPIGIGTYELTFRRSTMPVSFDSERLVELGSLSRFALDTLRALLAAKQNLIIAGGAESGKTTLLGALTQHLSGGERVGKIEQPQEVRARHPSASRLEARSAAARELFRASLRLCPDRWVIGEIQGAEALDIVKALLSGRASCLATLCATSVTEALTRLESMALAIDPELSLIGLRMQIAFSVNFIVQTVRTSAGSPEVNQVTQVLGYDVATGRYRLQDVFVRTDGELVPSEMP